MESTHLEISEYIEELQNECEIISFPTRARNIPLDDMINIFIVNEIKCRKYVLKNCDDWRQFAKSCYSLACQPDPDGWINTKGKKITFEEYMIYKNARKEIEQPTKEPDEKCYFFKYDNAIFRDNNKLITVYDERTKKRMIVDGLHRGATLIHACETNTPISEVVVYECYGENVNILFPADIHQL